MEIGVYCYSRVDAICDMENLCEEVARTLGSFATRSNRSQMPFVEVFHLGRIHTFMFIDGADPSRLANLHGRRFDILMYFPKDSVKQYLWTGGEFVPPRSSLDPEDILHALINQPTSTPTQVVSSAIFDKCGASLTGKYMLNCMFGIPKSSRIKNVIFNDPATIVMWEDGTKTVVKAQDGEKYDPEKGLAMALSKKVLGNKGNYYDVFKKWLNKGENK